MNQKEKSVDEKLKALARIVSVLETYIHHECLEDITRVYAFITLGCGGCG